jgi:modulator of FtsH protease
MLKLNKIFIKENFMGLYDRSYMRNGHEVSSSYDNYEEMTQQGFGTKEEARAFVKDTYQLFAASLLAATVGAYVGLGMVSTISTWYWGLVILEFALLFGLSAVKDKPGVNLIVLFAFTFITGLTITPLLASIFMMTNGATIVAQAFLMTSVAFGGISVFALTTTKDYSFMSKFLFIALIILIVGSISNIFIGSPMLQLVISMVGALLFSAFILYDTQQLTQGGFSTPIEGAIALYLDFFNLFISLLQIFGILGSDD